MAPRDVLADPNVPFEASVAILAQGLASLSLRQALEEVLDTVYVPESLLRTVLRPNEVCNLVDVSSRSYQRSSLGSELSAWNTGGDH